MDKLDEIDKFLKRHKLPRQKLEKKVENTKRLIISTEIETVI